jgi:cytochrome oxidase assembly protein ShyY1
LDNKIHHRRFGYEIITPFKPINSDTLVLINRGWLEGDISRRSLPPIEAITGEVELVGIIHVPERENLVLMDDQPSGWPRVVQSVKVDALSKEFNQPFFSYLVRLNKASPGSFQPNWVVVNVSPEKHTAYAVQWFAMSLTLLIILFFVNTNFLQILGQGKGRENKSNTRK